jgi:glucosylceramidase
MKGLIFIRFLLLCSVFHLFNSTSCKKAASPTVSAPAAENLGTMDVWLTTSDGVQLLQKGTPLPFTQKTNSNANIAINPSQTYQQVDGFGYSLTGGSAMLINGLPAAQRSSLLAELFGKNENSIRISYLRISIGASDLDPEVFSYNDLPEGQTDPNLERFSIERDRTHLIPVLKEILAINPNIKIMGSPWSPPVWMKDNGSFKGGSLKPTYYSVYATYFVKYIQAMKAEGITIEAITPQNEPLHPGNNPSLSMTADQQADFIKNHLGPKFKDAGLQTKIVIYDHNADRPDYPLTVLADAGARAFVDGTSFHLYAGEVSALSQVHDAYPDKNIYFTEQWTGANGTFGGDLRWHLRNVIIGTMRNWSRVALEWNLANDPTYGPHTPGGCTECKGALTIGNTVARNVSYYIIGHAAKFVPPGSVRIGSNITGNVYNVAFKTPENNYVLVAVNDGNTPASFNIRHAEKWATATLPAGAAATYVWQ